MAFGTVLVIWFFALIGLINTNPITVTQLGTNTLAQAPFGIQQYITNIFLPIFIIAILFSLVAEKKLSNDAKNHMLHTLLGSIAVGIFTTFVIGFGGIAWFSSLIGFVVSFWLSFALLFGIYYMVHGMPEAIDISGDSGG